VPAIAFGAFNGGLDRRRDPAMAASNVLLTLSNAYVNTAFAIKKRPCLQLLTILEPGTVGLRAAGGKLNTFYGSGATITHANALFRANRVPHPSNPALTVRKIHFAELFNGFPYVAAQYSDTSLFHHYLDESGLNTWAPATAYGVAAVRRPTVANGYRYRVQSIAGAGLSGAVEPVWPLNPAATVIDNPGADQVVWVADTGVITDTNCPHSRQVRKLEQKIYAASVNNVRYCKTADPRDWTAVSDAGFIPSGITAPGSDSVTALGDFGGKLAIFYADSLQIWSVSSDPANNQRSNSSSTTGTLYADAVQTLASDLIFLSQQGFRSASIIALTDNLQENDVGSAIDPLRSEIADADEPVAFYYPKLGQLWCVNRTKAYVYSFSRSSKLSAWQTYTFPVNFDAVAVLNNKLYVRSSDAVYLVSEEVFTDDGLAPLVELGMYYQDAKSPGVLKQFVGFDGLVTGSPEIAFKVQVPLEGGGVGEATTEYTRITGDLRPGTMMPMEIGAVAVAPQFRHQADEDFKLSALSLYFQVLAAL
jgi:hypothetical protein